MPTRACCACRAIHVSWKSRASLDIRTHARASRPCPRRPLIPPPRHGQGFRDGDVPAPSDHFLTQLRAFTPWRQQKGEIKVFKSF